MIEGQVPVSAASPDGDVTAGDVGAGHAADEPGPARAAFLRRWVTAFLLIAIFSTAWSLVTPPAGGPDEQYHVIKAAGVVSGQLTGRPEPVLGGGWTFVEVSSRWERLDFMPGCFAFHPTRPADCSGSLDGPTTDKDVRTRAGLSPPFYHGVVGAPTLFSSSLTAFYLTRLLGSLVAAALMSTALCLAAAARSWFLVGALAVSLTPQAAFLSGVVNPSSLEIAAGMLVWVSGLLLVRPDGVPEGLRRRLIWFFVAGAIPFALSRQPSPILLAGIVATLLVAAPWARVRELLTARQVRLAAAVVTTATLGAVAWLVAHPLPPGGDEATVVYGRRDMITVPLGRLGEMYTQLVATFGWLDTRPPSLVQLGWTAAIAILVTLGVTLGPRRLSVATGVLLVISLVVYLAIDGSLLRTHGPMFQGRYLLPLAMGIVLLPGRGIDEAAPALRRQLRPVLGVVLGITAVAHLVAIWFGARRFAVGTEGPVWFLGDARWQPAVPQGASLVLALVAVVGLVVWVWTFARGDLSAPARRAGRRGSAA